MKQTLNLTQSPDLDLYQKLELRISNVHVRRVVYLMHKGWKLVRLGKGDISQRQWKRAFWYLLNPSECFKLAFAVVPYSGTILSRWIRYIKDFGLYAEYGLRQRIA